MLSIQTPTLKKIFLVLILLSTILFSHWGRMHPTEEEIKNFKIELNSMTEDELSEIIFNYTKSKYNFNFQSKYQLFTVTELINRNKIKNIKKRLIEKIEKYEKEGLNFCTSAELLINILVIEYKNSSSKNIKLLSELENYYFQKKSYYSGPARKILDQYKYEFPEFLQVLLLNESYKKDYYFKLETDSIHNLYKDLPQEEYIEQVISESYKYSLKNDTINNPENIYWLGCNTYFKLFHIEKINIDNAIKNYNEKIKNESGYSQSFKEYLKKWIRYIDFMEKRRENMFRRSREELDSITQGKKNNKKIKKTLIYNPENWIITDRSSKKDAYNFCLSIVDSYFSNNDTINFFVADTIFALDNGEFITRELFLEAMPKFTKKVNESCTNLSEFVENTEIIVENIENVSNKDIIYDLKKGRYKTYVKQSINDFVFEASEPKEGKKNVIAYDKAFIFLVRKTKTGWMLLAIGG